MAGTQKEAFMDFPSKNPKMDIQLVDIHEFKDGKIVRTEHRGLDDRSSPVGCFREVAMNHRN